MMPDPLSTIDAEVLTETRIACFSMEIGFHDDLPTNACGLGMVQEYVLKTYFE